MSEPVAAPRRRQLSELPHAAHELLLAPSFVAARLRARRTEPTQAPPPIDDDRAGAAHPH